MQQTKPEPEKHTIGKIEARPLHDHLVLRQSFLHSSKSVLFNCRLVNFQWCEEASSILRKRETTNVDINLVQKRKVKLDDDFNSEFSFVQTQNTQCDLGYSLLALPLPFPATCLLLNLPFDKLNKQMFQDFVCVYGKKFSSILFKENSTSFFKAESRIFPIRQLDFPNLTRVTIDLSKKQQPSSLEADEEEEDDDDSMFHFWRSSASSQHNVNNCNQIQTIHSLIINCRKLPPDILTKIVPFFPCLTTFQLTEPIANFYEAAQVIWNNLPGLKALELAVDVHSLVVEDPHFEYFGVCLMDMALTGFPGNACRQIWNNTSKQEIQSCEQLRSKSSILNLQGLETLKLELWADNLCLGDLPYEPFTILTRVSGEAGLRRLKCLKQVSLCLKYALPEKGRRLNGAVETFIPYVNSFSEQLLTP